jgi:hypothetical protein
MLPPNSSLRRTARTRSVPVPPRRTRLVRTHPASATSAVIEAAYAAPVRKAVRRLRLLERPRETADDRGRRNQGPKCGRHDRVRNRGLRGHEKPARGRRRRRGQSVAASALRPFGTRPGAGRPAPSAPPRRFASTSNPPVVENPAKTRLGLFRVRLARPGPARGVVNSFQLRDILRAVNREVEDLSGSRALPDDREGLRPSGSRA